MKNIIILVFITLALFSTSCEDYVTNVDPLIDRVEDNRLDNPAQLNFLIKGNYTRFATTQDVLLVLADGLSDQFIFDGDVPNATFPTFDEIEKGEIRIDNNSVDGAYNPLGELRFFADDLVRRTNSLTVEDAALKNEALFTGYFFGGIARYFYATYFALNPDQGGGVIDNGPFIPSSDMYDLALEKFNDALPLAKDDYTKRLVNSLIARTALYKGDNALAATHAAQGLVEGDEPFQSLHNALSDNYYWQQAGVPRSQFVVDFRFKDYVDADPKEVARIPLAVRKGNSGKDFYYQVKYPTDGSSLPTMTWQENNLMIAELVLRGNGSGDPLALVNAVRTSHGLDALAAVDLDIIYLERDKELFMQGQRLPDQRRFNKWHLGADKWKYLPITENERNNNPNFN